MKKIIIVSNDLCAIKQIINTKNKFEQLNSYNTNIYNIRDFIKYVKSSIFNEINTIYFIDIYDIEYNFLDLLHILGNKDKLAKIIILNTNSKLKSLLESQKNIYYYLEKDFNFENNIFNILNILSSNKSYKLNLSNFKTPVFLNRYDIKNIYNWPGKKISVNYKEGDNNILISVNKSSNEVKKIIKDSFYIEKPFKHSKKNNYSVVLKQLLVDLYTIYNIDINILSYHFNVNPKYIKKWASLAKYNRKINVLRFLLGKIFLKSYFNHYKGSEKL